MPGLSPSVRREADSKDIRKKTTRHAGGFFRCSYIPSHRPQKGRRREAVNTNFTDRFKR